MTKYDKAVSVCFSGHRSVPFAKRRELKQCLKSEIAKAYADGYRYFYCGMAMGFDLLAAEAALSLQCELKDLQVIAVVPFRGQSDRWSKEEQAKYDAILRIVDDVVVLAILQWLPSEAQRLYGQPQFTSHSLLRWQSQGRHVLHRQRSQEAGIGHSESS